MRVRLSPPPHVDSPLARLDPRWRLAGLLLLIVAVALVRTLPGLALAVGGAVALALVGKLPWRWARGHLLSAGLLLAFFALPLPFLGREGFTEGARLGLLVLGKGL